MINDEPVERVRAALSALTYDERRVLSFSTYYALARGRLTRPERLLIRPLLVALTLMDGDRDTGDDRRVKRERPDDPNPIPTDLAARVVDPSLRPQPAQRGKRKVPRLIT